MATRHGEFLRFWTRLDAPVERRTYCLAGFGLAAIKYLGDVTIFALTTGQFWKPTDYLKISHALFWTSLPGATDWLIPAIPGCWSTSSLRSSPALSLTTTANGLWVCSGPDRAVKTRTQRKHGFSESREDLACCPPRRRCRLAGNCLSMLEVKD